MIFGSTFAKGIDEVSWWTPVDSKSATESEASSVVDSGSSRKNSTSSASSASSAPSNKHGSFLSPQDKDLFYNTYFQLIDYINRKYRILKHINVSEEQDSIDPMDLNEIASRLWENPAKEIDAYLASVASSIASSSTISGNTTRNTTSIDQKSTKEYIKNVESVESVKSESIKLLESWKKAIKSRFIIERYLKQGTIFISVVDYIAPEMSDSEALSEVYLVKSLSKGYAAMFRDEPLPLLVDATLLPFKDVIITDGLVAP